jgi:hypothetical protein
MAKLSRLENLPKNIRRFSLLLSLNLPLSKNNAAAVLPTEFRLLSKVSASDILELVRQKLIAANWKPSRMESLPPEIRQKILLDAFDLSLSKDQFQFFLVELQPVSKTFARTYASSV